MELTAVTERARMAAARHLGQDSIEAVNSEPSSDSEGNEAIRITIRLRKGVASRLSGDQTLDTLVAIQTDLWNAGEQRLPMVDYAEVGESIEPDMDQRTNGPARRGHA